MTFNLMIRNELITKAKHGEIIPNLQQMHWDSIFMHKVCTDEKLELSHCIKSEEAFVMFFLQMRVCTLRPSWMWSLSWGFQSRNAFRYSCENLSLRHRIHKELEPNRSTNVCVSKYITSSSVCREGTSACCRRGVKGLPPSPLHSTDLWVLSPLATF